MNPIDRKYTCWRIRIFAITWLAYAGFYLCRKNFSVVTSSLKEEFGFDNVQLGWISTAYLATYAVGQFLNGILGDKLGAKITVGLGLVVAAATNFLFGFGSVLGFFMIWYGINGYAQATGWPGLIKTMAHWFSVRERGIVMGWWGTCYQIGSAVATALAAFVLGLWGWRYSFFVPSLLLFGIAVAFFILQKNRPEEVGLPDIETFHGEPENVFVESQGKRVTAFSAVVSDVLSNPTVWVYSFSYFCLKLIRYALMFWLPLYMVEKLGYKPEQAGYYSTAVEVAGFLGAIAAGYVSDKLFQSRRGPICALMFFGLMIALYAHTHLTLMGPIWNVIGMGLIGFMMYGPDSLMTGAAAMDLGTKDGAATAAGFINGMGSVGAAFQGLIVGYISQAFGWNVLFYFFVGLAMIGFILMVTRWKVAAVQSTVRRG